ncbi:MAG: dihydropteroate synthase [Minicystis sp.]
MTFAMDQTAERPRTRGTTLAGSRRGAYPPPPPARREHRRRGRSIARRGSISSRVTERIARRLKACYPHPMTPLRTLLERRESVILMGILNRTPDSFSDGGRYQDDAAAIARVDQMMAEGAAIVDIGAESTRPGSRAISDAEQIDRLGDVVRAAAERGAIVSIDTTSPVVAERALRDGAAVVNSVELGPAAELGALAAAHGASLVLMHSRGSMADMAGFSVYAEDAYGDVVADVAREWSAAAERAHQRGLPREDLILDPGLGFFKNARQSITLVARLSELCRLGHPVLVGPSRKSFVARAAIGDGPVPPPSQRLGGSLAAAIACVEQGAAIVRTHDVAETKQALAVAAAIHRARPGSGAGGAACTTS